MSRNPVSWISVIEEQEAKGKLKELYRRMLDPVSGRVDNILRVHSLHPEGLRAHFDLYRTLMRATLTLTKADREMIALLVSRINGCEYWVTHHRRGLRRILRDDEQVRRTEANYEKAGLDARRVAMLRYVEKLTRNPGKMVTKDVQGLREAGWVDGDILNIAEVAAYYAFANRIADGLGVQLESENQAEP